MAKQFNLKPITQTSPELDIIHKEEIGIDYRYQRKAPDAFVRMLAREWNPRRCGAINVARRPDGTLWAVDGGTRLRAALLRPDVRTMLCVTSNSSGPKEEAALFEVLNGIRRQVTPMQRYKALLWARDPLAVSIHDAMCAVGYSVSDNHGRHSTSAAGALMQCAKEDAARKQKGLQPMFRLAIQVAARIAGGEKFPHWLIKAAHKLAIRAPEAFAENNMAKMERAGLAEIDRRRRAHHVTCGGRAPENAIAAMLDVINLRRHKRNRIYLRQEDHREAA